MVDVSAPSVLELWERGSACAPLERALVVLGLSAAEAEGLTIGACASRLLGLHEALFGGRLNGFAECPGCGESLEVSIETSALRAGVPDARPASTVEHAGYEVCLRQLTWADLMDAGRCASVALARAVLVEHAVVSVSYRGRRVSAARLPSRVMERVAQRLAESDPWAESLLALVCPACRHQWTVLLDVAAFLWTEIRVRAQRLLHEVHTLASAYAWREADILAMSNARREAYLALVGV